MQAKSLSCRAQNRQGFDKAAQRPEPHRVALLGLRSWNAPVPLWPSSKQEECSGCPEVEMGRRKDQKLPQLSSK